MAKKKVVAPSYTAEELRIQHQKLRDLEVARNQLAKLMTRGGMNEGRVVYDSSVLTPRIRNAAIRALERGAIVGGGESMDVARLLNEHFHLDLPAYWGTSFSVTSAIRATPALVERLTELSQADMTSTLLLEQENQDKRRARGYGEDPDWRTRVTKRHKANLLALADTTEPTSGRQYYGYDNYCLYTQSYFLMACVAVAELRTAEQRAKVQQVVDAVKANLKLEFAFSLGQPVTARIIVP